jgi:hypothetical protein
LQTSHPYRLQIYTAVSLLSKEWAHELEAALLQRLRPFSLIGEWVKLPTAPVCQLIWKIANERFEYVEKWHPTAAEMERRRAILGILTEAPIVAPDGQHQEVAQQCKQHNAEARNTKARAESALAEAEALGIRVER